MKKTLLFLIISFFYVSLQAQNHDLTVKVDNIKDVQGVIRMSLFNNDKYPQEGEEFRSYKFDVTSNIVSYKCPNLPAGKYAIALYHDKNNDDECNMTFMGIPKEAFGISNNVTIYLTAPTFEEAAFYVNKNKTITITLKYMF